MKPTTFNEWLLTIPGTQLLQAESRMVQQIQREFGRDTCLIFGETCWDEALAPYRIPYTLRAASEFNHSDSNVICCDSDKVPLRSEAFSLVVVPHLLEFVRDPQPILNELVRLVAPQGFLFLTGFNPVSPWHFHPGLSFSPWFPYTLGCVERWLKDHSMCYITHMRALYCLPTKTLPLTSFQQSVESMGSLLWPFFGGIYGLLVQKNESEVVPTGLSAWFKRLRPWRYNIGQTT